MKSTKIGLFLTLTLVLTGAIAFAQEDEGRIKISGENFTSINMGTGAVKKNTFAMNLLPIVNFGIDRLYLKWDHELSKNFSYHVILDVAPDQFIATGNNSYVAFVKNAYLRTKGGDDNLFISFDIGVVNTPIISNRNKMADTRWFEDVMYNGHKNIIGMITNDPAPISKGIDGTNGDYDQSADLGFMFEINILKVISLSLGAYTGEGYANVSKDLQPNFAGKAWYGDLFIEPVRGLYFHGYVRYQTVQLLNDLDQISATTTGIDAWFTGGGVGINMMGIRFGADFEVGQNIIKNPTVTLLGNNAKNFFVLNVWLNWNLNEIAGFPMLVVGRFSYGMFNDAYASYTGGIGVIYDTVYWSAGIGWRFNKNVRFVLLFEMNMYTDAEIYMSMGQNPYSTDAMAIAKGTNAINGGWNNSSSAAKIKIEVKF